MYFNFVVCIHRNYKMWNVIRIVVLKLWNSSEWVKTESAQKNNLIFSIKRSGWTKRSRPQIGRRRRNDKQILEVEVWKIS